METKSIILELRDKAGLSQDELAEKVYVTRQAVSRWENGETTPNTETLKLLSKLFDVSINTRLGSPRQLICQCCGMPLEDSTIIVFLCYRNTALSINGGRENNSPCRQFYINLYFAVSTSSHSSSAVSVNSSRSKAMSFVIRYSSRKHRKIPISMRL